MQKNAVAKRFFFSNAQEPQAQQWFKLRIT